MENWLEPVLLILEVLHPAVWTIVTNGNVSFVVRSLAHPHDYLSIDSLDFAWIIFWEGKLAN